MKKPTPPKPPRGKRPGPELLLAEQLTAKLLAAGKVECARRDELRRDVEDCLRGPLTEFNYVPPQIRATQEYLQSGFWKPVSADEAIGYLMAATHIELEPDTREYIANQWDRRRAPQPSRKVAEDIRRYKLDGSIRRLKDMLRQKYGIRKGAADAMIAGALGVASAGTLLQRLQRARRK